MKYLFLSALVSFVGPSLSGGLPEHIFTAGHTDLRVDYQVDDDVWTLSIDRGASGSPDGPLFDPSTVVLVALPESRMTLPAIDSQWNFLGAEGDDVWILAQTNFSGELFLGFNQYGVASGSIEMTLLDHEGPADFALYTAQFNQPTVFWDTRPAEGPYGIRTLQALGHSHANWAFRERGIHFLTVQASGKLVETDQITKSDPVVLTFAVDPTPWHWWQLEHFGEAANRPIAAPANDFDGDGLPNFLQYALGIAPYSASREGLPRASLVVDNGDEFLALSFRQPSGRSDVRYEFVASDDHLNWREVLSLPEPHPLDEGDSDGGLWMTVRDDVPINGVSGRTMRLRVIYDPSL